MDTANRNRKTGTNKEGPGFNVESYDYLDRIDLVGWAWEFIRRQKNDEDEVQFLGIYIPRDTRATSISAPNQTPHVKSATIGRMKHRVKPGVIRPSSSSSCAVDGMGIIPDAELVSPPEYAAKYRRIYEIGSIRGTDKGPEDMLHNETGNPFVVMFLVDVSGKEEEVQAQFDRHFKAWRREFKRLFSTFYRRKRDWKTHLMVYDLKETHRKSFEEIAQILFPLESNDYADGYPVTKKVRKHYKAAERLIAGEFKRYIPDTPAAASAKL